MRRFKISVEGVAYEVTVEELEPDGKPAQTTSLPKAPVATADTPMGTPLPATRVAPKVAASQDKPGDVVSPLAGTVLRLEVNAGQTVNSGEPLLVLEAMKMESIVAAPIDGRVQNISVSVGESVQEGQLLLSLMPA